MIAVIDNHYWIALPAFHLWRDRVDQVFIRYTGRSSFDLPIPDQTWRAWWTSGRWPASRVGEILSDYITELDRTLAS